MNIWYHTIGLISAALTTASFIPQAIKTWKTKSTHDLSRLMFSLFCTGITGWLIYGIMINNLPVILSNALTIIFAGSIMFQMLRGRPAIRIHHLGLYVEDLVAMKNFYTKTFNIESGEKYINSKTGFSSYFLNFPSGLKIELMHVDYKSRITANKSWGHIAVSVGSRKKVDNFLKNLPDEIKIIREPGITGDGYYEFVFADPEGNQIEITT